MASPVQNYDFFTAVAKLGRRVDVVPSGDPADAEGYRIRVGTRAGQHGGEPVLGLSVAEAHALHAALSAALDARGAVPSGWRATAERTRTDFRAGGDHA